MRIGIDARMYGIAQARGIGRYVQELIRQLLELQGEFVLFLSAEGMKAMPDHPHVQKILAPFRWYSVAEQLHMPRLIQKARLDLMHFTHFNVPYFCPVPYVVTLHDLILLRTNRQRATTLGPLLYTLKYTAWKILLRHTLKNAQRIIVPSQAVKDELTVWMPKMTKKTSVIYEGAPELTPPSPSYDKRGLRGSYILYVGSAYPHKNLERLVQAFEILTTTLPPNPYTLILVGKHDYFYERLKRELQNTPPPSPPYEGGDKGEVIFMGEVTDNELTQLYRHAALVVCPALSEGFGLPALEAAVHGAPLACSDIPVLKEMLGNETAFFFNPHDVHDMARVLHEALTNVEARQQHIKNARMRAQNFSWKKMAEETEAIYLAMSSRK